MTLGKTPGVYVKELNGPQSITGASTSVPVYIGQTEINAVVSPGIPTLIASWDDYQKNFGGPVWRAFLPWAVYEHFNEGGGLAYVVRAIDKAGIPGRASANDINSGVITFSAASPGSWGNLLQIVISNVGDGATNGVLDSDGQTLMFKINVCVSDNDISINNADTTTSMDDRALLREYVVSNSIIPSVIQMDGAHSAPSLYVLESFDDLAVDPDGTFSKAISKINRSSIFIRALTKDGAPQPTKASRQPTNGVYPLNRTNGAGTGLGANDGAGADGWDPALSFAPDDLHLSRLQGISLLAMPDTVAITANAVNQDGGRIAAGTYVDEWAAINAALAFSEKNNIFYVVDVPLGLDISGVYNFKTGQLGDTPGVGLNSSRGAMYWPAIKIINPVSGAGLVKVPPSGAIIGRYISVDTAVGVYQSPAGVQFGQLMSVASLAVDHPTTDTEQDLLNPEGINVIRNKINYGILIWGARTLSKEPDWKYVAVSRLFILVEESLRIGLQWVVFKVNNPPLWESVKREVTAFLSGLWHLGALFGDTQDAAFRVTCDGTNNTASSISDGYLNVKVELAAVRPAEFVVLTVSQKMADPASGS